MGIFSFLEKKIIVDGYEIDKKTGYLISLPVGLRKYVIPKEVKDINYDSFKNARDTMEVLDLSKTQIESDKVNFNIAFGFTKIRQVIVPEHFKSIGGFYWIDSEQVRNEFQINIPKGLKTFDIKSNPWFVKIELPWGVEKVADFSHNNCLEELVIPGSLINKTLPSIYQEPKLKKLIIGEGIEKIGDDYRGLGALEFVSIPTTLNKFIINECDGRHTTFPRRTVEPNIYAEKITIEKAFGIDSYFGKRKIKFVIPREPRKGLKIQFTHDRIIINGISIYYSTMRTEGRNDSYVNLENYRNLPSEYATLDRKNYINSNKKNDDNTPIEEFNQKILQMMRKNLAEIDFEKIGCDINAYKEKLICPIVRSFRQIIIDMSNRSDNKELANIILSEIHRMLKEKGVTFNQVYESEVISIIKNPFFDKDLDLAVYIEIIVFDYILNELLKKMDEQKLTKYLNTIINQMFENQNSFMDLQNFSPEMKGYAYIINSALLPRVVSYYGTKGINENSVTGYIKTLRNQDNNRLLTRRH